MPFERPETETEAIRQDLTVRDLQYSFYHNHRRECGHRERRQH